MKRIALILAATLLAGACGDDSPTEPSGDNNRPRFTAQLLPSNEVPPITNEENTGTGSAVIHLNLTRDPAGAISAATADFQVELSGFPATTAITLAHIHIGAVGVNGGIVVNTTVAAGQVALTNGVGSFSRTGIAVTAANAQAIVNNPAGYYFNVHTSRNPGGVIRGQLVRAD
jgi:hypothetical protein